MVAGIGGAVLILAILAVTRQSNRPGYRDFVAALDAPLPPVPHPCQAQAAPECANEAAAASGIRVQWVGQMEGIELDGWSWSHGQASERLRSADLTISLISGTRSLDWSEPLSGTVVRDGRTLTLRETDPSFVTAVVLTWKDRGVFYAVYVTPAHLSAVSASYFRQQHEQARSLALAVYDRSLYASP